MFVPCHDKSVFLQSCTKRAISLSYLTFPDGQQDILVSQQTPGIRRLMSTWWANSKRVNGGSCLLEWERHRHLAGARARARACEGRKGTLETPVSITCQVKLTAHAASGTRTRTPASVSAQEKRVGCRLAAFEIQDTSGLEPIWLERVGRVGAAHIHCVARSEKRQVFTILVMGAKQDLALFACGYLRIVANYCAASR